jgi:hypothetical protein
MFEGCKCTLCKCAAASVVCCCFMAVGQHEEYCEHHYRPAYCNMPSLGPRMAGELEMSYKLGCVHSVRQRHGGRDAVRQRRFHVP